MTREVAAAAAEIWDFKVLVLVEFQNHLLKCSSSETLLLYMMY